MKAFRLREVEETAFRSRLDALERRGEIARVRGEKYSAIEFSSLIAGRITVRPEGFGFVLVKEGDDLFVPRVGMHGAMDGDTVLAREEKSRATGGRGRGKDAGRTSGVVVRVLERARERVVGRFETKDGRKVVLPYDPKIDAVIRIEDGETLGAREGEIVQARLTDFPDGRRVAHGVVEEKLGFLGEPGVDIEIVLRSHNLPTRFPDAGRRRGRALPGRGPHGGPARPARLPRPPDHHDRRRDRQGLRRRHRGHEERVGLPHRRAHRRRLALRRRGLGARRRGALARDLRLFSRARAADAPGAALQRALLAEPARRPARAFRDPGARREGPRDGLGVHEGRDPQRAPHDVHRDRPHPRRAAEPGRRAPLRPVPRGLPPDGPTSRPCCGSGARRGARSTSTCRTRTSCSTTRGSSSASSRSRATSPTG